MKKLLISLAFISCFLVHASENFKGLEEDVLEPRSSLETLNAAFVLTQFKSASLAVDLVEDKPVSLVKRKTSFYNDSTYYKETNYMISRPKQGDSIMCKDCHCSFETESSFCYHFKIKHKKPFACENACAQEERCIAHFTTHKELIDHISQFHALEMGKLLCFSCGLIINENSLINHRKTSTHKKKLSFIKS